MKPPRPPRSKPLRRDDGPPLQSRPIRKRNKTQPQLPFDPMPNRIEPCLAVLTKRPPAGNWSWEIKWDGYRVAIHIEPNRVRVLTRGGYDWTDRFPAIAEAARSLGPATMILDSEAVVLDEQGRSDFGLLHPWDIGTARILAALGFRALATTSAGMAFSYGVVEGQTSKEDILLHCRTLVSATPLPVSADLENGFGDTPESSAETLLAAASIGLAGCSLEDHTGNRDDPIYDFTLAVERIQAAAEARSALSHDFVLTARCENFMWGRPDLDDTIKRLQAFEAAGADVLYAPGLKDLDTIRIVCEAVSKPVNVVMGLPSAVFDAAELAAAGVKRISVGSALARLAYGAFVNAAREMATNGTFRFADQAMGFAELEGFFTGMTKA